MTQETTINLFEPDEWKTIKIDPEWSEQDLLDQEGMVELTKLLPFLKTDKSTILKHVFLYERHNHDPYKEMGLRRISRTWFVRMKVFSVHYQALLKNHYNTIPEELDQGDILKLEGRYNVEEVCERLSLDYDLVLDDSRESHASKGIHKFPDAACPEVVMPKFVSWIKEQGDNILKSG